MNECSFNILQTLNLALQSLRDIMRDLEGCILIHYDVDFSVVLLTRMVCSPLRSQSVLDVPTGAGSIKLDE